MPLSSYRCTLWTSITAGMVRHDAWEKYYKAFSNCICYTLKNETLNLYNFLPTSYFWIHKLIDFQKEMSTQVFILCDKAKGANLILVSFRGTEPFDADDWSTDFDYSWYEIPKVGKIHMGFLEALGLGNRDDPATFYHQLQRKNTKPNGVNIGAYSESLFSGTDSDADQSFTSSETPPEKTQVTAYDTLRSKLKRLLEEHEDANFIVTGHSLGGALAILFPTVLVVHEEMEMMERLLGVYTFGQPRIGNRQLGRFMEAHLERPLPKYFRVVYCNDIVPRLPYDDKTFLYKHFGRCLYYNSLYVEKVGITNTIFLSSLAFLSLAASIFIC